LQLKANEIERYINNPTGYHPIILIYGPDQGLVSERSRKVQKKALEGNPDPFALQSFESDDIANDPARLADEAAAIALFGGKRIIRLRLSGNRPITKSIEAVLGQSNEAILLIEAGDLKKNNPVRILLEKAKAAATLPCYSDDVRNLSALLNEELQVSGARIDADARELLLSLLGENRQTSRNEIRKLILYAHGKTEITRTDVEELIGDAAAFLTDDTIDLAMAGQTAAALVCFERSLAMGMPAFQIAQALQRHLSALQLLSQAMETGRSLRETIDKARPPIHYMRKESIADQLKFWRRDDIIRAQDRLLTAIRESRLKPGLADTILYAMFASLSHFAAHNKRRRN